MSELSVTEMIDPGSTHLGLNKVYGHIHAQFSKQAAAATLTDDVFYADFDGQLCDAEVRWKTVAAAGESMVIDIQKNGASVLTGTYTIDSTQTAKFKDLSLLFDKSKYSFVKGDRISVVRTYVAGGGPAPIGSSQVKLEMAKGPLAGK